MCPVSFVVKTLVHIFNQVGFLICHYFVFCVVTRKFECR